ncbi:hypothetical protein CBA19CS22_33730 [Caballeronia novacaledonica]|uniref:Uncharacterized protein n=1 Tax=Caballeronia novacaledonica TaxID=1544861 RepID=A0ACB5R3D2_9BURK|nr:hypothetical protein CBA19CS22_33730 [Caballeronia novacaledonica]
MKPSIVIDVAHTDLPCVTTHWDDEGSTLSCEVDYSVAHGAKAEPDTLSDRLNRDFNIVARNYVLTGGTFSLVLDSQKRIKDWDIFTMPAQWIDCAFPFIEAAPGIPHLHASFDENRHAETLGVPEIFYEPNRGTLYLSWAEAITWHAIGAALALGVSSDSRMAQLRLDGVLIPKRDQKKFGS